VPGENTTVFYIPDTVGILLFPEILNRTHTPDRSIQTPWNDERIIIAQIVHLIETQNIHLASGCHVDSHNHSEPI
jgi:hypothetical protein